MRAMSAKETSSRRVAGVTVPLFSLRGPGSWGIGEIGDLPAFAHWVRDAGLRLVQLLPLGEIGASETSPYAALTAFGIDPIYISLGAVPDLGNDADDALARARTTRVTHVGGDSSYAQLARVRESRTVDYATVRTLKQRALRVAFDRFYEGELLRGTPRAGAFRAFVQQNESWLSDFALFRALKDAHAGVAWWDFHGDLRDRRPKAVAEARITLRREILHHQYAQWIAHSQWYEARARLRAMGVEIMGDLPFMVGRDSADVWSNQGEFRDDASVGAPPDAFNEDGQDWGLPPYDWRVMRATDFAWLRRRCRYTASLYDRFRIDHLIGFYRTYMRNNAERVDERGKLRQGYFDPGEEKDQLDHGERVLTAMLEASREGSAQLIAEDLGVIPPWTRRSLAKLAVPGYKVLIWEKDQVWDDHAKRNDDVFRDPSKYPPVSLACFGTHDTTSVATWWESLAEREREAVKALPQLEGKAADLGEAFTPAVHDALVDLLNGSSSDLVLFLVQDILGTKDRINTPATIGSHNWTYRLPGTPDELRADPALGKLTEMMRKSVEKHGR
jgi:4-alpha-glucanotransferase